jgi:DNA repair protein RadA/Sms
MVLAVLDRRLNAGLARRDTYVATVGGVRLGEPSSDLAVALAIASAHSDRPLRPGLVAIGEVGLAGEVRPVSGVGRRLSEAARLGFTHAVVPDGCDDATPSGIAVLQAPDLQTALSRSLTVRTVGPDD